MLATLLRETSWGTGWVLQVLGSAGFLLAVFAAEPESTGAWWLAGASAVVLAFAPAMSGHAAAMEQSRAITVTNDAAHVLAASAWVGTLACILCAGLPVALRRRSFEPLAMLVRRFSPLALMAAAAAALTGTVGALEHLGPLSDLWRTAYGRALTLKLFAVASVGVFGFFNWRQVRPNLGTEAATHRLRRSGGTEIGLALLVLLATAVLIALPTP
jgi:putative copper export protein